MTCQGGGAHRFDLDTVVPVLVYPHVQQPCRRLGLRQLVQLDALAVCIHGGVQPGAHECERPLAWPGVVDEVVKGVVHDGVQDVIVGAAAAIPRLIKGEDGGAAVPCAQQAQPTLVLLLEYHC